MSKGRSGRIEALIPKIVQLWAEGAGMSALAISRELSVGASTVLDVLRRHPDVMNRPEKKGRTKAERQAQAVASKRRLRGGDRNLKTSDATPGTISEDMIDKVVRAYEAGLGHPQIAAQMGPSEWTVYRVLKAELDEEMRRPGPQSKYTPEMRKGIAKDYKSGLSMAEVAEVWRIPRSTIQHILRQDPTVKMRNRGRRTSTAT